MDAQMKVSRAITRLVLSHPFFGSVALSVKVSADETISTMCTDGKSILWSPDFVDGMDEPETTGVVAHEVSHIVFKHMLRRGSRDPELWNIACDFAINAMLIQAGFTLPKGGLYDEQYEGLPAESIYDRLPEDAKDLYSDGASIGEVKDAPMQSDAEAKQMEADIDAKVMMAAAGAKAVGKLPASIEDLINVMKRSQVDYRDKMRRFIGGDQPDDYTMRKPNRKLYHTSRIIAPSIDKVGAGDVVLGIDSSLSVSNHELSHFLGEVNAISADIKPRSITVITFDTKVRTVREYQQGEEIDDIHVTGRGGTLVGPLFDHIEENNLNVDNMVVFTDMGICDYPSTPEYPVLWVSSWDQGAAAPFGETTYISMKG